MFPPFLPTRDARSDVNRLSCFLVSSSLNQDCQAPVCHPLHRHTPWDIRHYLKSGPPRLSARVQGVLDALLSASKDCVLSSATTEVLPVLCQTFRPVHELVGTCVLSWLRQETLGQVSRLAAWSACFRSLCSCSDLEAADSRHGRTTAVNIQDLTGQSQLPACHLDPCLPCFFPPWLCPYQPVGAYSLTLPYQGAQSWARPGLCISP